MLSLEKISYPNTEVIVVDNGSATRDFEDLAAQFPHILMIRSEENLGFAGGNNLGIKAAKGKYLMLLNNDTEVTEDFLGPLVTLFEQSPGIGAASPKIKYYHSPDQNTIQWGGSDGVSQLTVRGSVRGGEEEDTGQCDDVIQTQLVHGAAMMVPIEVVQTAGLMPDIYFLYYEEHDWIEMIKRAGYSIYYVGTSTVYHKESMSVGAFSPMKVYYMYRGRLIFTRRNRHGINRLASLLFFAFFAFPKNLLQYILRGEWKLANAFLAACAWNLRHRSVAGHPALGKDNRGNNVIQGASKPTIREF